MIRVLADTNIYISYLLSPKNDSFVDLLFDKVASGEITLLVVEPLLEEIERTVKRKPNLLARITETHLTRFIQLLTMIAESIPTISAEIPAITRDPKDDFLIAYAVVSNADYLVSVDKDLLVLEQFGRVKIVHSGEFRAVLAAL
ncbi:MAG: putative toxin-antitoxin system toxin component, PIN family [Chloroflexota bacterium]